MVFIKKKQLILFAFLPSNDYNINTIKISLLLLSFCLYFTLNGFFFSDDSMYKIYEDKGSYDILYQMPQILYSTLITSFINIILRTLSLSEKIIIEIKEQNNIEKAREKSKNVEILDKTKIYYIFYFKHFIYVIFLVFYFMFLRCV